MQWREQGSITTSVARAFASFRRGKRQGENMTDIISRIRKTDGKLVHVYPDGREVETAARPIRPMTEEEILAAAMADPDAQPMTPEQEAIARQTPRAKSSSARSD